LRLFMESAAAKEHGVIFVSFGSVLKAKEMAESKRKQLVAAFGRLKQQVIWKWETEEMKDAPANLKLSKWLPQQDILAHPNTKLFVTHAGQSSSQETVCHRVPIVGMPVLGDQFANAREAERVGFGKALPFHQMTEDNLYETILEVLTNPSYAAVADRHGSLLVDQLVSLQKIGIHH